jgi:hypothetical protein
LSWASRPEVRGLAEGVTPSWAWGEVLAHLAATGNPAQQAAALDLAMQPYRAADLEAAAVSESQLRSLSNSEARRIRSARNLAVEQVVALALVERRLGATTPETIRNRHAALVQILGPVAAAPHPHPVAAQLALTPDQPVLEYSDEQWEVVLRYPTSGSGEPPDLPPHVVRQNAGDQLEIAAKREPARFARLLTEIGSSAHPDGIRAVINAITSAAHDISADTVLPVVRLAQAALSWELPQLNHQLCGLISALADHDLPAEIITGITSIATAASDNEPAADTGPLAAGWATDQGQALITLANLLTPPRTRHDRARTIADGLTAAADDLTHQAPAMLPAVLARICSVDAPTADELTQRWLAKATDRSLSARDLDLLAWELITRASDTGTDLVQRMLASSDPEVRMRAGALAAAISLNQTELPRPTADASALLQTALNDPAARNGVAKLAAQRVNDLPEQVRDHSQARSPGPAAMDCGLLARLLDDPDSQVRETAASYPLHLNTPCHHAEWLLSATAASRAYAEHPASTLHMLRLPAAEPPVDPTLDLCERWLATNAQEAGDIRTAAAGDGYYIVDIALAIHARTSIGSDQGKRTLDLLDRLIESGVINANSKVDAMGDIYV